MPTIFRILLLSLLAFNVQAQDYSFSLNTPESTFVNNKITLYNFSPELLSATKNCSPYQEDFTTQNPKLKLLGKMLGNADFQVLINIKGLKNNNCEFDITQQLPGISGTRFQCSISPQQRQNILTAMQDRSAQPVTKTFNTYYETTDPITGKHVKNPQKNTVTDSLFNVTLQEIQNTNCQVIEIVPSEAETEQAQKQFNSLPESFLQSLTDCTPDTAITSFMLINISATIIGKKSNFCLLNYQNFDLYIPEEQLSSIHNFTDLDALLQDHNIAQFDFKSNYKFNNLYHKLANCSAQHEISSSSSRKNIGKHIKSQNFLNFAYKDNECTVQFGNQIIRNQQTEDYGLICKISDQQRQELIAPYEHLTDASDTTITDNFALDKRIFVNLLKNKLCIPTSPESFKTRKK